MAAVAIPLAPLPTPEHSDVEDALSSDIRELEQKRSLAGLHVTDGSHNTNAFHYERQLGDNELSYYLPSRATGVNDMYLHIGFRAPERFCRKARVRAVWAIMRARHPLLASKVNMHDYDDVRFCFTPPSSPGDALVEAERELEYRVQSKDELIDRYLNGPRTLSNDRLSYLIISRTPLAEEPIPTPPVTPSLTSEFTAASVPSWTERAVEFEFMLCAAHFIGDGMALHATANDFFGLLGSEKSDEELEALAEGEWRKRWERRVEGPAQALPRSSEKCFPKQSRLRRAVGQVGFQQNQEKQIGGQAFPRQSGQTRHTVVPTVPFDEDITKKMLKKCKANGVSIASALFAICNIAWARMSPREKQKLPMMMYAALNVRPYFDPKSLNDSYWFLAVGYFNVILPNFIPSSCDAAKTFWLRARAAKDQSSRAAKSPMVVSHNVEISLKRGKQARIWAKEDDEKEKGTWVAPPPKPKDPNAAPRAPSAALIGLSLLGNLDGIYKHATFPAFKLHTLTTGSRQRNGGMLMFGYTFAGKLFVSLGYDQNGFERETVDAFWSGVLSGITEFLI